MKKVRIFKGKTKPYIDFVGTTNKPNTSEDKFGKLRDGEIRGCIINTRWGQLSIPYGHIGKKIEIIVKIKEKNEGS